MKSEDDFEVVQSRWESAQDEVLAVTEAAQADAARNDEDDFRAEIREANRYGTFDLKYATRCARCGASMQIGTSVIGRKVGDEWIIEHTKCPA